MPGPRDDSALYRFLLEDKSPEELAELAIELSAENVDLRASVLELTQRVADLEDRLGVDSSNSHHPPSKDPPGSKAGSERKQRRKKSGKKKGGQPGRKGTTRQCVPASEVNRFVDVHPSACGDCDGHLSPSDLEPARHQVWELPREIRAEVTEYRLHALYCPWCNRTTRASLPEGVPAGAFGQRVHGAVAYLSGALRLSDRQVAEVLQQFFGLEMAVGTVANIRRGVSSSLATPSQEAQEYVRRQPVVHADETSWRDQGALSWLWVASTPLVSLFRIQPGRGKWEAQLLLGDEFDGVLVSDRLYSYGWATRRQLCWAHLVRDFRRIAGRVGLPGRIGRQLEKLGEEVLRLDRRRRSGELAPSSVATYASRLRARIRELLQAGAATAHPRTAGTCRQILRHEEHLWTFVREPEVPATNNEAERALRHGVIWRKTRQGTQSTAGARFAERVMTVVATLKKQGRNVLDYLEEAVAASLSRQAPPSLLPA